MVVKYLNDFLASEAFKSTVRDISSLRPWVSRAVTFFCCYKLTNSHLVTAVQLQGPSMLPTVPLTGNWVLAERLSTRFDRLAPGDIVLLRSPLFPLKTVVKRLVAMEGHTVTYRVDPMHSDDTETVVVPKGHVWVEGDNIYTSRDSRLFGPVPYALIKARVFWRCWPPKEFGSLPQSKRTDPVIFS